MSEKENFVSRWSRLKQQAETASDTESAKASPEPSSAAAAPVQVELPPVESLTMESDFSVFMRPEVDESLRRTALRKLLRDPHFNVMDGLDTYIDDYGKPDPIPAAMMSQLAFVKRMLRDRGDEDRKDEKVDGVADTEVAGVKPASGLSPDAHCESTASPETLPIDSQPMSSKET